MNIEYHHLIIEKGAILRNLPEGDALPEQAIVINKRLKMIQHTLQSNSIILADTLTQNLDLDERA